MCLSAYLKILNPEVQVSSKEDAVLKKKKKKTVVNSLSIGAACYYLYSKWLKPDPECSFLTNGNLTDLQNKHFFLSSLPLFFSNLYLFI